MSAEILKSIQAIKLRLEHIIEAIPSEQHAFAAQLTSTLQEILHSSPEMVPGLAAKADNLVEQTIPDNPFDWEPWQREVYVIWSGKK